MEYTGFVDRIPNRKTFILEDLLEKIAKIEAIVLQGEGVKIIKPSNIIDIWTRLEVLLGLKIHGHTKTLTEATNLIDELYKRGKIPNEQRYRNALEKLEIFKELGVFLKTLRV